MHAFFLLLWEYLIQSWFFKFLKKWFILSKFSSFKAKTRFRWVSRRLIWPSILVVFVRFTPHLASACQITLQISSLVLIGWKDHLTLQTCALCDPSVLLVFFVFNLRSCHSISSRLSFSVGGCDKSIISNHKKTFGWGGTAILVTIPFHSKDLMVYRLGLLCCAIFCDVDMSRGGTHCPSSGCGCRVSLTLYFCKFLRVPTLYSAFVLCNIFFYNNQ